MKRFKPNRLLLAAWILFSIAQIGMYVVNIQNNVFCFLNGFACGLMIVGVAICAPVSRARFEKIKVWKIRLIGR